MKYYRVTTRKETGKIIGYCKESTLVKVEALLGKGKFWVREIPEAQWQKETKEIQFVF